MSHNCFSPDKTYSGSLAHEKLFAAGDGQSFHCRHEQVLRVSSELRIKLLPLQVQAFTLPEGQYGAGDGVDHLGSGVQGSSKSAA